MPTKKKNPADRKVTVAIKDLAKVCHNCGKVNDSTMRRNIYTKNYKGPCGDSFCYASCDMDACRSVTLTICNECETKLKKSGT